MRESKRFRHAWRGKRSEALDSRVHSSSFRATKFFIAVLEALTLRYVANEAGRSSADLVRSVSDIIRHAKDLLGLPIDEQVVITKVLLVHVSEEILRPQANTPCHPSRRCKSKTIEPSLPFVM
jgi:hypothetical protein